MSAPVAEWAIKRALEIADYSCTVQDVVQGRTMFWGSIERFAAYIAAHEEPPVANLSERLRAFNREQMGAPIHVVMERFCDLLGEALEQVAAIAEKQEQSQ